MSNKRASSDSRASTRGLSGKRQIARKNSKNAGRSPRKPPPSIPPDQQEKAPRSAENCGGNSGRHTVRRSGCFDGFWPSRSAGGYSGRWRTRLSHAGGGHERRRGDSFERWRRALLQSQVCGNDSQATRKSYRNCGSLAGCGNRARQIWKLSWQRLRKGLQKVNSTCVPAMGVWSRSICP